MILYEHEMIDVHEFILLNKSQIFLLDLYFYTNCSRPPVYTYLQ